jgi:hypothetical protein
MQLLHLHLSQTLLQLEANRFQKKAKELPKEGTGEQLKIFSGFFRF